MGIGPSVVPAYQPASLSSSMHASLDLHRRCYLIWECQALAKMANELGLGAARVERWTAMAANIRREMDELMWERGWVPSVTVCLAA